MPDQADLARGWMLKGDSDRLDTQRALASPGPYYTACFHTQQAAEKYLKALLALAAQPIPRTHDLVVLYDQCVRVVAAIQCQARQNSRVRPVGRLCFSIS